MMGMRQALIAEVRAVGTGCPSLRVSAGPVCGRRSYACRRHTSAGNETVPQVYPESLSPAPRAGRCGVWPASSGTHSAGRAAARNAG